MTAQEASTVAGATAPPAAALKCTHRHAHERHGDDVTVLHQVDDSIVNVEPTVGLIVAVIGEVGRVPAVAARAGAFGLGCNQSLLK